MGEQRYRGGSCCCHYTPPMYVCVCRPIHTRQLSDDMGAVVATPVPVCNISITVNIRRASETFKRAACRPQPSSSGMMNILISRIYIQYIIYWFVSSMQPIYITPWRFFFLYFSFSFSLCTVDLIFLSFLVMSSRARTCFFFSPYFLSLPCCRSIHHLLPGICKSDIQSKLDATRLSW